MSKAPERSPEEFRELVLLRDDYRKKLYSENDPDKIGRLRRLIEELEIEIRQVDPIKR